MIKALEIIKKHSPTPDADYSDSWVLNAMKEIAEVAMNMGIETGKSAWHVADGDFSYDDVIYGFESDMKDLFTDKPEPPKEEAGNNGYAFLLFGGSFNSGLIQTSESLQKGPEPSYASTFPPFDSEVYKRTRTDVVLGKPPLTEPNS
jgi:hypothetical protein